MEKVYRPCLVKASLAEKDYLPILMEGLLREYGKKIN
jgi:hypothetical protein